MAERKLLGLERYALLRKSARMLMKEAALRNGEIFQRAVEVK